MESECDWLLDFWHWDRYSETLLRAHLRYIQKVSYQNSMSFNFNPFSTGTHIYLLHFDDIDDDDDQFDLRTLVFYSYLFYYIFSSFSSLSQLNTVEMKVKVRWLSRFYWWISMESASPKERKKAGMKIQLFTFMAFENRRDEWDV